MVKIAPYSLSSRVSFKNNQENPVKQQTQNSEYYKTTSGVKTAAGYSVAGLLTMLCANKLINNIEKSAQEIAKESGTYLLKSKLPRIGVGSAAWFLTTTFACGVIADKFINKKREKLANDLKTKDADTLMKEDKHIQKTDKGNLYYKSSIYKNVGPLLALGVLTLNTGINILKRGAKSPMRLDVWELIDVLCTAGIGGSMLGAITDKFSKKAAREFADKKYFVISNRKG